MQACRRRAYSSGGVDHRLVYSSVHSRSSSSPRHGMARSTPTSRSLRCCDEAAVSGVPGSHALPPTTADSVDARSTSLPCTTHRPLPVVASEAASPGPCGTTAAVPPSSSSSSVDDSPPPLSACCLFDTSSCRVQTHADGVSLPCCSPGWQWDRSSYLPVALHDHEGPQDAQAHHGLRAVNACSTHDMAEMMSQRLWFKGASVWPWYLRSGRR